MKTTISIPVREKSIAILWADALNNLSTHSKCSAVPVFRKNARYVSFTFDTFEGARITKINLNTFVVFNPAYRPLKYQLERALAFARKHPEKCEHQ